MKQHTILLLFVLAAILLYSPTAKAGFHLPDDAYTMNEFDSALQEAQEDEWPITFLFSDEYQTCRFVIASSNDILNVLSEDSIILYVAPNTVDRLPQKIFLALANSGSKIPRIVITDSCAQNIITVVPFNNNSGKHLQMLEKARDKMLDFDVAACRAKDSSPKTYMIAGAAVVILILGFFMFRKK